jgi:hypothetical protein
MFLPLSSIIRRILERVTCNKSALQFMSTM